MGGEVKGSRRALARKSSRLLQRVDIFDQAIRLPQVSDVCRERIIHSLGALHQSGKVVSRDVGGDIGGLKLRVDAVLGGVSVGIRADPAVVLDGGVQRL